MDQLFLHIEYLLRHHDCVILPGIGAFLNLRKPAAFDPDTNSYLPPSKEICFNASIRNNDGLIANSIARRERVSYEEACMRLDSFTSELIARLENENEIEIGNIGTLSRNDEGNLSFHQRYTAMGMARLLGYYPVKMESGNQTEDSGLNSDSETRKFRTDKYYYIPVHKTFAKVAAMFACVVTLCLALMLPLTSDNRTSQEFASVVPINTVKKAISETISECSVTAETPAAQENIPVMDETDCSGKYFLIVGSFRTMEEAEKFIDMNGGNRDGIEFIKGNKLIKVSAKSSNNRDEVLTAMRNEEMKSRFGQSWIWTAD